VLLLALYRAQSRYIVIARDVNASERLGLASSGPPRDHARMPSLGAKERAALPNSAFAYVDSAGQRRLPIHDEAHVRNALARFGRVHFEDDAARDRARMRLLKAAKKHGIMPLGFVGKQLGQDHTLPRGNVTFLLADIEGSTGHLQQLGDGYGPVLVQLRRLLRSAVRAAGGREIDARGDEYFGVFERPHAAIDAAMAIHRALRDHRWPEGVELRVRIGIHTGRASLNETGYIGLAVHTVARVCTSGHGGQIVISAATRDALAGTLPTGVALVSLGTWRLNGLRESTELLQVQADDLRADFPPPRPVALAGSH
jgi:class 3 adenylate cyclase